MVWSLLSPNISLILLRLHWRTGSNGWHVTLSWGLLAALQYASRWGLEPGGVVFRDSLAVQARGTGFGLELGLVNKHLQSKQRIFAKIVWEFCLTLEEISFIYKSIKVHSMKIRGLEVRLNVYCILILMSVLYNFVRCDIASSQKRSKQLKIRFIKRRVKRKEKLSWLMVAEEPWAAVKEKLNGTTLHSSIHGF